MPYLQVCPLSKVNCFAERLGARELISIINLETPVEPPKSIERRLFVGVSDIVSAQPGHIAPNSGHMEKILDFSRGWNRQTPLLIHCWAGVSRSVAAAFAIAAALSPQREEMEIARAIRAASPTATPNPLLISLADDLLMRGGRMRAAAAAIGRGEDCFEGVPFRLDLSRDDSN